MIRVLHSVSNMDRAGIETMVMNFYRHMDRSRVQFVFLANKHKVGAYEEEIAELGGKVYRSPGFNPLKFPAYVRFLKQIKAENPDLRVLHVHNGALGAYALLAGKLSGMKNRVYHAHGCRIPKGRGHLIKCLVKPLISPLTTTRLACGTEAAKFYYSRRAIRKGEYMLIHNAIDLERFCFNGETRRVMREKHGLTDRVVIGHIGRFSPQKNHLRLLDIFAEVRKRMPNALLLLIGEGDLTAAVEARAKELGIAEDVRLVPPVGDTSPWYQAMDLFLLPSVWEGLPVVAVEAQATGLPCVVSTAVTEETKVTDAVRFVSLEKSDGEWAAQIEQLLEEKHPREGKAAELREAGYDICLESEKLQRIYEQLAEK